MDIGSLMLMQRGRTPTNGQSRILEEDDAYFARRPRRHLLEGHEYLDKIRYSASIPRALQAARSLTQQPRPSHLLAMGPPSDEDFESNASIMQSLLHDVLLRPTPSAPPRSPALQPRQAQLLQPQPEPRPRRTFPRMFDLDGTPTAAALSAAECERLAHLAVSKSATAEEPWAKAALLHSPQSTQSQLHRVNPPRTRRAAGRPPVVASEVCARVTNAGARYARRMHPGADISTSLLARHLLHERPSALYLLLITHNLSRARS